MMSIFSLIYFTRSSLSIVSLEEFKASSSKSIKSIKDVFKNPDSNRDASPLALTDDILDLIISGEKSVRAPYAMRNIAANVDTRASWGFTSLQNPILLSSTLSEEIISEIFSLRLRKYPSGTVNGFSLRCGLLISNFVFIPL